MAKNRNRDLALVDDDDDAMDPEVLPALTLPKHVLDATEPKPLKPESTDEATLIEDLKAVNLAALHLHNSWKAVTSIQEVCQLVTMTGRLIEYRRRALGKQHGPKNQITNGRGFVYPID